MEKIRSLLKDMKFKKKLIGGVDELDVWKKIDLLQEEYERQFKIQEEKYEAIIEDLKLKGFRDE